MIDFIFYYVIEFFRLYVSIRFMNIFFQNKNKGGNARYVFLLLLWTVKAVLDFAWQLDWLNLVSSIVAFLMIALFCYDDKFWRKLLGVFLLMALTMVCEDGVWILLNHYLVQINHDFLGSILSCFLLLILQTLLQRDLNIGKRVEILPGSHSFMLLIPICSIIITNIIDGGSFRFPYAQLIGIMTIMLMNILTFYLYDMILRAYEEKAKNILLEKQVAMYENQFKLIKESQEHLSSFRHDMKHHSMMIRGYAGKQKMDELLDYIDQGLNYIEVEREYVRSGNEEIDCILNYMIDQAKGIGTEVTVKLVTVEEKFMPGLDLNILLSNLLENSIDALRNVADKKLDIYINMDKGVLYISIYNTYGEIKREQGKFMSLKRNYKEKGIGLENVQKIVDKYNGKLHIGYDEDLFKADVLLILES